jgi:mono/diheme cytochrome c family protein
LQQPFNLQVAGGVKPVSKAVPGGRTYQIAHFQIFQGDQVRAYPDRSGRRVRIAADGSAAAFVPARRALTWQSTDRSGTAIVRERNGITFRAGEMRSCASCHGTNTANQAGLAASLNKPQALRNLLNYWKTLSQ